MRKTLLATTALAAAGMLAAGPALSADKMSVGVGGYMQQWIGMSSVDGMDADGNAIDGGVAQQSDTEIFFKGKLESDSGLAFSVKVELEGNGRPTEIDESQLTVSGAFGAITLGAEDPAITLTHHGVRDAGFGMLCGDIGKWINGIDECSTKGLGTAGHGLGDKNNITYFSPRMSGVQFGVSYIPNSMQEDRKADLHNNDMDAWAIGGNFKGDMGGSNVAVSVGHYERSQVGEDAFTYSNIGLNVGMGAFSFDVAYATGDDGMEADGVNDVDVVAVGLMYSDGPMSVSFAHTMADAAEGTEQSATLLSASYSLAPGIAWRSTLFGAEKDRSDGSSVEGTGFVTGFTLGF